MSDLSLARASRSELEKLLRQAGCRFRGKSVTCPFHDDKHPSASLFERDGAWHFRCFTCNWTGDIFDVTARLKNRPLADVLKEQGESEPPPDAPAPKRVFATIEDLKRSVGSLGTVEAVYSYTNPTSQMPDVVQVRYIDRETGKKKFLVHRPVKGGFALGAPEKPWPIYNRTRVAAADRVVICEGEKCVHALHEIGIVATTSLSGASNAASADWSPLSNMIVYIWPDNDEPGELYAAETVRMLERLNPPPREIWVLKTSSFEWTAGFDAADFCAEPGITAEDVWSILNDASERVGEGSDLDNRIDQLIGGQWRSIDWPWGTLSRLGKTLFPGTITMVCGDPGATKCLAPETPLLASDGRIVVAGSVAVGDKLMGDDSTPRTVTNVFWSDACRFRIVPVKGMPFIVSGEHILRFAMKKRKKVKGKTKYIGWEHHEMSVFEFLGRKPGFREHAKLVRVPLEFPPSRVPLDPYFLGVWLGDGTSCRAEVTTADAAVAEACAAVAERFGCRITKATKPNNKASTYKIVVKKWGQNPVLKKLLALGVLNNKHIPIGYLRNSVSIRRKLLAGLIDSDGRVSHGVCSIVQKNERLAEDVAYLARSLGLAAYSTRLTCRIKSRGFSREYSCVNISGHLSKIPTRVRHKQFSARRQVKDVLHTGFSVEPVESGPVVSIAVNKNKLHLLADCTVVHNSFWILAACYFWHTKSIGVSLYEHEDQRADHQMRLMAMLAQSWDILDDDWCRLNPALLKERYAECKPQIDSFRPCLFSAPLGQMRYAELLEWIDEQSKLKCIIAVDPITAVGTGGENDDREFLIKAQRIIQPRRCRLILATHPRNAGKRGAPNMDDMARGRAFSRYPQSVLWIQRHDRTKSFKVSDNGLNRQVSCNRTVTIAKSRNGTGQGKRIAFKLGADVRFEDLGMILTERKMSDDEVIEKDKDEGLNLF